MVSDFIFYHQQNQQGQENQQNQQQCPEEGCTGNEILCISIPNPINIVLLGHRLEIQIPCVRVTSPEELTPQQAVELLHVLTGFLNTIGSTISNDTSQ